jgi:hypothetical protein
MKTEKQQEKIEVAVIPPPDAVVHPRTMMIEAVDTPVANGAMGRAWRSIEFTRNAPLHSHSDSVDFHIFIERRPKVIQHCLFRRSRNGMYAGIHGRRHEQIGNEEKE